MPTDISRRDFLQAAGGITFLALTPVGRGFFARHATAWSLEPPLQFSALPYIQPGSASALSAGAESLVIAWQTEDRPAEFAVEYGRTRAYGRSAPVQGTQRPGHQADGSDTRRNYAAALANLELGTTYVYRVRQLRPDPHTVAEGYFTTRKPRGVAVRFLSFGDNSYGDPGQRAVAYWAYRARPDFIVNTGDNVYESGLDTEYQKYFYPIYNADHARPDVGAPLLRSVPFYTVLANHDVHGKDGNGHPAADLDKASDALAYYTALHLPLNGPVSPPNPTPAVGAARRVSAFRRSAGDRYPRMGTYSFDCGDAHFLCLDSNVYVDPTDERWHTFIADDLRGTDAIWKFVVYHHPAFNVGANHYKEQQMRAWSPLFEAGGVDFVLSGHEHNYQRTRPLKFKPTDVTRARARGTENRIVPGDFVVDTTFDGVTHTRAVGVQYITTGAGGKELYDEDYTDRPNKWLHAEDRNTAYLAKMVSDRHSLTVFDIDGPTATLTQLDEHGAEVDRVLVTKG